MNFEWNLDIKDISEFEMNRARELVKNRQIKDVYLEDKYIVVEYTFQCQELFISNLSAATHNIKKMRFPVSITDICKIKCNNKVNYQCKFKTCIIVLAGYLFYLDKKNNYYSNVIDEYDIWDEDETIENIEDQYETATQENILDIFLLFFSYLGLIITQLFLSCKKIHRFFASYLKKYIIFDI